MINPCGLSLEAVAVVLLTVDVAAEVVLATLEPVLFKIGQVAVMTVTVESLLTSEFGLPALDSRSL